METYHKAMQSDEWRTPKGSRHQRKYQLRQQKPNKSKQTDIQNTGAEKNHEVKTLQKKKKTKTEKSRAAARAAKQEWRSQRAWDDHIALLKEETELRMDAEQQERRKLRKQAEQAWNDHFKWLDDYLAKNTMLEDEEILFTTTTFTRKRKYSEAF
jgi:hypothetical protein